MEFRSQTNGKVAPGAPIVLGLVSCGAPAGLGCHCCQFQCPPRAWGWLPFVVANLSAADTAGTAAGETRQTLNWISFIFFVALRTGPLNIDIVSQPANSRPGPVVRSYLSGSFPSLPCTACVRDVPQEYFGKPIGTQGSVEQDRYNVDRINWPADA